MTSKICCVGWVRSEVNRLYLVLLSTLRLTIPYAIFYVLPRFLCVLRVLGGELLLFI